MSMGEKMQVREIYVPLSKIRSTISPWTDEEGGAADLRLVRIAWYSGALSIEPSTTWVASAEWWAGTTGGAGVGIVGCMGGTVTVTQRWKKEWKNGRTIDKRNALCHIP